MLFSKKIIGFLNRPKTSAAEAEGRLLKSFGIGRLCSASVIVCPQLTLSKLSVPSIYIVVLELKHSTASFSTQNPIISKETCKFKGKDRIRCKSLSEGSLLFSSAMEFFL